MSMAIGGTAAIGNDVSVKPLQYAVNNESRVSDAFVESMNRVGAVSTSERVGAAVPVRYPDARIDPDDTAMRLQEAVTANRQYNQIASEFSNSYTGYTASGAGTAYALSGANVDYFA